ncbi:putative cellulase [Medicago truncatula]|uniref:Endoglucanase n=1 Tax=Medicago truncatula TaxID=3880 RepID=A0A072VGL9_MEDTR|nr:endoglucanase 15 [Medicago truncatula]KEH40907.1 glycosyl hydrolase family 9 protein [Medicago truncatula]RHN78318.1 putative cellulase [Medicago truncatula]
MSLNNVFIFILLCCFSLIHNVACADYGTALTKSLLFFEGQRSGVLPSNQRVTWRGDSALKDGQDAGIDLVGGYYDAGDNLKLGFPMAFTTTMLSWSTIEFKDQLGKKNELTNALAAIKWGTDYLMKAHQQPNVLYGEIGDPDSDHQCWQRPEDMSTPRNSYKIDEQHPGSDLAAETAAALAAASIAFQSVDNDYASKMLVHATQLFDFANNNQGLYHNSIPPAAKTYSSSGYKDELLWAAAWLYHATNLKKYLDYLGGAGDNGGARTMFSWDDKYLGAQILAAKLVLDGTVESSGIWTQYKANAEQFICSCAQKSTQNFQKTPGGLLWFQPWGNNQYVSTATFAMSTYSQYLSTKQASLQCNSGVVSPSDLTSLVQAQVDYILGSNPKQMSYMVGYGSNYPQQIHHRGASIISIKQDSSPLGCKDGFEKWFNKNAPNPNTLEGAIVSPDQNDDFTDNRNDYQLGEPTTVSVAPLVGVLAYLA